MAGRRGWGRSWTAEGRYRRGRGPEGQRTKHEGRGVRGAGDRMDGARGVEEGAECGSGGLWTEHAVG